MGQTKDTNKNWTAEFLAKTKIKNLLDDFLFFLERMDEMIWRTRPIAILSNGKGVFRRLRVEGVKEILDNLYYDLKGGFYKSCYSLIRQLRDIILLYAIIAFTPTFFQNEITEALENKPTNKYKDEEWLSFAVAWMKSEGKCEEEKKTITKHLRYEKMIKRIKSMLDEENGGRAKEYLEILERHKTVLNDYVHTKYMAIFHPDIQENPKEGYERNLQKIENILEDLLDSAVGLFWMFDSSLFVTDELIDRLDIGLPYEEEMKYEICGTFKYLLSQISAKYPDKYSILVDANKYCMNMPIRENY